jgi:hypothetical protein
MRRNEHWHCDVLIVPAFPLNLCAIFRSVAPAAEPGLLFGQRTTSEQSLEISADLAPAQAIPPGRRVAGPNASWVMAPFTHVNVLGSRFSNGTYGIYYAARYLETAIRETIHHFGRFASDSHDPPRREDMRVLLGSIDRDLDDVAALDPTSRVSVLDPNSYTASQPFGLARRNDGSDGLVYPSVRHAISCTMGPARWDLAAGCKPIEIASVCHLWELALPRPCPVYCLHLLI